MGRTIRDCMVGTITLHKTWRQGLNSVLVVAILFFGITVSSCGAVDQSQTPHTNPSPVIYFHIRADYELIETGEPLNFDYVLSCRGYPFPSSLFKATSTGAAIAIAQPEEYCQRAINSFPIERSDDRIKMPVLTWYDDVKDLSLGYVYLSNDAYTSPHAKVQFKSYDVRPATRDDFIAWKDKAKTEYKQIGAIPGPHGCATSNLTVENPHYCNHPDIIARTGKNGLMVADDGTFIRHMVALPMVETHADAAKAFLEEELHSNYYCHVYWYFENGEKKHAKLSKASVDGFISKAVEQFRKDNVGLYKTKKNKDQLTYLSPKCLLQTSLNCDIVAVYPRISAQAIDGTVAPTMLYQERYRGLAVGISGKGKYPEKLYPKIAANQTQFDKQNEGVLFINDEFACAQQFGNPTTVYDFERQEVLHTPSY